MSRRGVPYRNTTKHSSAAVNARSTKRALNAGLELRPLEDTLADILAGEPALGFDEIPRAGLANAVEKELLDTLRSEDTLH